MAHGALGWLAPTAPVGVAACRYGWRRVPATPGAFHRSLGHDQAAVRLAGVYALARLADDWAEQRQVCIDVL
ncbi:hypothetical protein [Streptomyces sp. NPDC060035]|uniref:hypothetical protein n=1 Tax=Streptomyces sp. NPDC060035 TaxID=3347044 RepID=UPI0036AC1824